MSILANDFEDSDALIEETDLLAYACQDPNCGAIFLVVTFLFVGERKLSHIPTCCPCCSATLIERAEHLDIV